MSLFDFFKRKQAKADKITKVYDKPLPEPTVNPKDNQPSTARYDEATSAWARKMMELEDETDPDVLTELDPDAERAREVRFWIDNMALCVKHNFAPEQYDVGGMLHQLIEEEEYELARELLFCCIDEVRNRPSTPCIDDILVYFAWICYKDGDGDDEDETDDCEDEDDLEDEESQDDCDETDEDEDCDETDEDDEYEDDDEIDEDDEYEDDEDDEEIDEDDVTFETEYHNLRSAHELVVAVSDHFTPHWRDTHLWLACLYNECYVNYDDYEIADLPGSHSPNWYGQQAYRYFSKAAEEGQYLAMNLKALFLVMGHQVKPTTIRLTIGSNGARTIATSRSSGWATCTIMRNTAARTSDGPSAITCVTSSTASGKEKAHATWAPTMPKPLATSPTCCYTTTRTTTSIVPAAYWSVWPTSASPWATPSTASCSLKGAAAPPTPPRVSASCAKPPTPATQWPSKCYASTAIIGNSEQGAIIYVERGIIM